MTYNLAHKGVSGSTRKKVIDEEEKNRRFFEELNRRSQADLQEHEKKEWKRK